MRIVIASDHAGIELRKEIVKYLEEKKFVVQDLGRHKEKANYAVEGVKVGENISIGNADKGIVICGTGIGITISANKVRGIRAGVCNNKELAQISRMHNDLNVLGLGARIINKDEAIEIVNTFLTTPFEGGRHEDRIDTISDYEESCVNC